MLKQLEVAGYGQALAGLDWLALDGLESQRTEIRQLATGANASWQFLWVDPDQHEKQVALVSKKDCSSRPVAAASLLCAAIPDKTYLSLISIEEGLFWVFALVKGLPAKRMDFVGSEHEVMAMVRDFVSGQERTRDLPVYTDEPDLISTIPYRMELRSMSLEVLGHSLKNSDYKKAAFDRYSPVSLPMVATLAVAVVAGSAYMAYQSHSKTERARAEALAKQQAKAENMAKIQADIDMAINSTLPAEHLAQYVQSLHSLPATVGGWRLSEMACKAQQCEVIYAAQALTTWRGYMQAKPVQWPEPQLEGGIDQIVQPIVIAKEPSPARTKDQLPLRNDLSFDVGNLAQISRLVGLQVHPLINWEPVTAARGPGSEEVSIPVRTTFDATGPAVLLESFAHRLPAATGIEQITFAIKENITFSMKVQAYAQP